MNATVTESIDARILQLLGLEDTFDLDYETYIQLLKERLIKVTVGKEKLLDEDFNLLKEELKRVKGEDKSKKFKIKSDKFFNKKKKTSSPKINAEKLILPGKGSALVKGAEIDKKSKELQYLKYQQGEKEPKNLLLKIDERLSSILESLLSISKTENKSFDIDRRERERKKREEKEGLLEKGKKLLGGAIQKIIAPFQNIFDRIWKFITFTLLGRAFTMLMNWLGDPKNKKKVETLGRFLKDWWPALLFGVVAFTNPFGKLVRSVLGTVVRWTFRVSKFVIPKLLRLVKSPAGMGLALFTAGAWVPQLFPQTVNEQERKTDKAPGSKEDKIKALEQQKANLNLFEKLQGKGAEIDEQIEYLKTGKTKSYGFYSGGFVSGEAGVDKVPAMLSDGEFVMSRGAVQKFGIPFLESLNAAGGGTNKPKVIRGVPHAAGGGSIGGKYSTVSGNNDVENIKKFIKHKIGYDVDRPETWGPAFKSGISSVLNKSQISGINKGFDFQKVASQVYNSSKEKIQNRIGNLSNIRLSKELGGGRVGDISNQIGSTRLPKELGGGRIGDAAGQVKKLYNQSSNDPRIKKVTQFASGVRKKAIGQGFLSKGGKFEGAARMQATNFLSDMLPVLPGTNFYNKKKSEHYLSKIGLGRNEVRLNKKGEDITSAFYGGSSGIDRAHNIGSLQVNKMSKESRQYYLAKIKSGLASGTLKSGDIINAYDLPSNSPIRREQGSVRFYVSPEGKPYLLDTYGFDPGKVDLGSAQKDYDKTVKEFQNTKTPLGKVAKFLDLKPMADATEGGTMVQFGLALRNKIFGYDPLKEAMKGNESKRFKTKVQVEELSGLGLGDLKALGNTPLTPEQKRLVEEAKKRKQNESKNQKALESKRPWWDKMGLFGGASAQIENQKKSKQDFLKKNPGTKLYNKPQANTGQPYKSRFARPARGKTGGTKKSGWNPFGWFTKRQGGGLIGEVGESEGIDYPVTASDRQVFPISGMNMSAALEPGEYVLPKSFVQKMGVNNIDSWVGEHDRDSTAAKLGFRQKTTPNITPYSSSAQIRTITLPPITSSSGGSKSSVRGSGSAVPDFPVIPAQGIETRMMTANILGIVAV